MNTKRFLIIVQVSLEDDWKEERVKRFIARHFQNKSYLVKEVHSISVMALPRDEDEVEHIRRRPACLETESVSMPPEPTEKTLYE